ncbi:MAG: histidine phosphatase family protein [Dehalococcoidia bacterium]|nr:histidine phosphatase family protein [Dehalococcoidia bacterium]MCA9853081.1 histidine phosphatase family protein [Dehalococcoidia bacterium]
MTIYLVRHGETAFNRDGLGLGRSDEPLTELGQRQAAAVADALAARPIAAVYSSPLQRAKHAAELIARATGSSLEVRPDLTELDAGDTEGLAFPLMRERFPDFFTAWRGNGAHEVPLPGGESITDLALRLQGLAAEIRERATSEGVCVVSHNFVQRALLCDLLGIGLESFRSFAIELASITTLSIRGKTVRIESLNDVCHLHSLEPSGKQT